MTFLIRTTVVFLRPFELPHFAEILPAGEYDIEVQHSEPSAIEAFGPGPSVLIRLPPRPSHPGLVRTLTVPFAALERATAKDKLTGKALLDVVLEEMLNDPMVRLIMRADGVGEADIRKLYSIQIKNKLVENKSIKIIEDVALK
nr:hypothetical protein [uncultured Tistrella sp.]